MSTHALPTATPAQHSLAEVLRTASAQEGLGAGGRRSLTVAVLAAHLAGAWGLMQVDGVRQAVSEVLPLQVDWIAPPAPTPAPPPPPAPKPTPVTPRARPVVAAPAAPAAPAPSFTAPVPEPVPAPPAPAAPPAPPAPAAPPAPPATPPAPKQIPASAVRYIVPPAQVYPLASKRLQEQGTVLLRLVVDVNGLPQRVTLHQSSGFARLDEQALQAMRSARFKPHTENGTPIEWTAIAPLAYELD